MLALTEIPKPDDVADALAIGASRALTEAGYRIPSDVSLAGYDGIDVSNYIIPSLTTIRQPIEEMAKEVEEMGLL